MMPLTGAENTHGAKDMYRAGSFLPSSCSCYMFLPPFLPSFFPCLSSFLPSFLLMFLPSFLTSLCSILPSFRPSALPSLWFFLPSFLMFRPSLLPVPYRCGSIFHRYAYPPRPVSSLPSFIPVLPSSLPPFFHHFLDPFLYSFI